MTASQLTGEICDVPVGKRLTALVGEDVFAAAGRNRGEGDVVEGDDEGSVRCSSSFKSSTGTSQVRALRSIFLRFARRAGLQRDVVARMKAKRRAMGSGVFSNPVRIQARAASPAPAWACATGASAATSPRREAWRGQSAGGD